MSNIKQLLTQWKWNGMQLANPFVIMIRLALHIPIKMVGLLLVCMLYAAGYQWQADAIMREII